MAVPLLTLVALAALSGCSSTTSGAGSQGTSGASAPSTSPAAAGSSAGAPASGSSASTGTAAHTALGTGSSYYPIGVGNTWTYRVTVGAATGTSTDRMTAVKNVAAGRSVTVRHTTKLLGNTSTDVETLIFHPDGSITVPLPRTAGATVRVASGAIVWPSAAGLAAGQSHSSTLHLSVATPGGATQRVSMKVTVKGGGSATVSVPAGTYHADVIDQTMSETFDGHAVTLHLKTWVVNGIGPVQSMLISATPGTTTRTALISFTKG